MRYDATVVHGNQNSHFEWQSFSAYQSGRHCQSGWHCLKLTRAEHSSLTLKHITLVLAILHHTIHWCSPTPSVSSCLMWRRWEEVSSDLMWQILRWARPAPHLCGNWCFSGYGIYCYQYRYITGLHVLPVNLGYIWGLISGLLPGFPEEGLRGCVKCM